MTDKTNALVVTLEKDVRVDEEQLEAIINAIQCIRGVIDVRTNVVHVSEFAARMQERHRIQQKVMDALQDED